MNRVKIDFQPLAWLCGDLQLRAPGTSVALLLQPARVNIYTEITGLLFLLSFLFFFLSSFFLSLPPPHLPGPEFYLSSLCSPHLCFHIPVRSEVEFFFFFFFPPLSFFYLVIRENENAGWKSFPRETERLVVDRVGKHGDFSGSLVGEFRRAT